MRRMGVKYTVVLALSTSNLCRAEHFVDITNSFGHFQTSVASSQRSVSSPLGGNVGYSYRHGRYDSYFAKFHFLGANNSLIMNGYSFGYDRAIVGGQEISIHAAPGTLFVDAPSYRIGLAMGVSQKSYDFSALALPNTITKPNSVPISGQFFGLETGVTGEYALRRNLKFTMQIFMTSATFKDAPKQSGWMMDLSTGVRVKL